MKLLYKALIEIFSNVAAIFLFALPVWFLWNAVIPEVFGLKAISYLQAVKIFCLADLLFKTPSSVQP